MAKAPATSRSSQIRPGEDHPQRLLPRLQPPLPVGWTEKWDAIAQCVDTYTAPKIADPSLEYATTVAQGLANGPHTLELIPAAGTANPIAAVRVYAPPVQEGKTGASASGY